MPGLSPARGLSADDLAYPRTLLSSAVLFILAGGTAGAGTNQFTMGNNGAISTLPVLPAVFSGGAFLYLPANAIQAGSSAGWYWFVASSTTAGTVYNNTYVSGDPRLAIPVTPTAFATTGPGVVTQTTGGGIPALQHIVPGGSLGANGSLYQEARFVTVNNANAKTASILFGGAINLAGASGLGASYANVVTGGFFQEVCNRNSLSAQETFPRSGSNPWGTSTNTPQYTTYDTSADQYAGITLNLGTATDFLILAKYRAEARYSA